MDDLNKKYLIDLHQHQNSSIEVLREFAEVNEVPIVDRLTLDLIKQLIRMNNVKNILEIGTAIGYSSMQFASISDDIHVTTIERNETMIQYLLFPSFHAFPSRRSHVLIQHDPILLLSNILQLCN